MVQILLLEDNRDMLAAIREALEIHGHRVITGVDGRDGYAALDNADVFPDVVITDLKMPHVGGLEVLRYIKGRPQLAAIGVIVMSGSPLDEKRVISEGADAFILKPFKHFELEQLISGLGH